MTPTPPTAGSRPLLRLRAALALLALCAWAARAAPRGSDEARRLAQGWLRAAQGAPLHQRLSGSLGAAEPVVVQGRTVGYAFALRPTGFIVTSADDEAEPVVAFSRTGRRPAAAGSPLAALLRADLPRRPAAARAAPLAAGPSPATLKWEAYTQAAEADGPAPLANDGLALPPADLRVSPLLDSRWGQMGVDGQPCYNLYTPSNYPCGCNGTSWGQLMRYHQHPAGGIGVRAHPVLVDGLAGTASTRGGDGAGGPYAWASMPGAPDYTVTPAQRAAIGALTYDIVVAISTNINGLVSSYEAGETSSYVPPEVVTDTFGYARAVRFEGTVDLEDAVNANLDAGLPVIVALPGHAVVCDGYGFQGGTAYHHLNMGWDGQDDAWYTLGDIESGGYLFQGIQYVYANVFPAATGEVVSGRVVDGEGAPIANATVTLSPGGRTDVTDNAGVYAFAGVASGASVSLSVAKAGYTFAPRNATLGTSQSYTATCGNRWGNDFTGALSAAYRLVSGRVADARDAPLAGVEVLFSDGGGSAVTDGGGGYAIALPIGWSGTLAPQHATGYFEPAAYAVSDLQADQSGLDFTGTLMRYVRHDAAGANDGSSWADAHTSLVTALAAAPADHELWVAAGTYTPGSARDSSFFFRAGQQVYGGFAGVETRREQRDWAANRTLLSGEIGNPASAADNCYTVVRGAPGARLDGATVAGGNASYAQSYATEDELAQGFGGGVFIWDEPGAEADSFVLDRCVIRDNRASNDESGPGNGLGGGLFRCLARNTLLHRNAAQFGAAAFECLLENCTVVSNTSSHNAAVYGGYTTNSIVYYNLGAGNLYPYGVGYSCTTPGWTGTGNITAAPRLINTPACDFMIATNSPCRNAGAARAWMDGARDLFGDSRASGAAPDMGAYELQAAHPAYDQRPDSPLALGASFAVRVKTRYGWSYRLQYRASLASGAWQNVAGTGASAAGDGTVKTLTDAARPSGACFYRVLAQ